MVAQVLQVVPHLPVRLNYYFFAKNPRNLLAFFSFKSIFGNLYHPCTRGFDKLRPLLYSPPNPLAFYIIDVLACGGGQHVPHFDCKDQTNDGEWK